MDARWLVPEWPAPSNVRAVCTTREGGVSAGRYESLNLGDHVGDEPAHVAENRSRLRAAVGARPVFLQQVHGTGVVALDAPQDAVRDGTAADACTATATGLACTIMVADCLPVLFTDESGHRVAAAHAGWRGLAGGVLEQTVKAFEAEGASRVIAWLGPCIGPKAFEVGPEVKAAFEAHAPEAASCFRPAPAPGKWLADLPALARQRLQAAGIGAVYGNDGSDLWCTVTDASRFFSHRRDGVSGRFAALVWKV
ncbi:MULTISPECIES: peptidoglycan editing factor PgeF [unclassified Variovorax]|jgi:YfiH family protein|uniref:peptidoglycan editing factor PgeF n=1 Tax=unclassified Variovorax TaxID=663243 RepID=UPI000F7F7AB9|nr:MULTISPECIES: peptidoglycan editing factor PgeF [unclassified Variovorax]RSZ39664.1 peptidoglycan editing factor PgeF [Variovorax sp. 553]RSZ40631.1 peptidoglycan editing factor PgeF [Variovorax sp. 679]